MIFAKEVLKTLKNEKDIGRLIYKLEMNFVIKEFNALSNQERERIASMIRTKGGGAGKELVGLFTKGFQGSFISFVSENLDIEASDPLISDPTQLIMRQIKFLMYFQEHLPDGHAPIMEQVSYKNEVSLF